MLKLKTLDIVKYSIWVQKLFRYGASRGCSAPNVNLGPPQISETTGVRKLKLQMPFDTVKYLPQVQKFFCKETYRERRAH